MRVDEVCKVLVAMAPPSLAAEWDNVGLPIGDRQAAVRRLLLAIDLTAEVVAEARRLRAQMVMAYHPPIFRPIGRLTADAAGVVWAAARANLAVYSMHTALDAAPGGTNDALAEALGLAQVRPLRPTVLAGQCKLAVFTPEADLAAVSRAAFAAGAGRIGGYTECSFRMAGTGTFHGGPGTHPSVGRAGRREEVEEFRLEMIVPAARLADVGAAVRQAHSYETPAIDVYPVQDLREGAGMGRIGTLPRPLPLAALVARIKRALGVRRVAACCAAAFRLDGTRRGPGRRDAGTISTVAVGAGSCGGDLLRQAAAAGAQAYVTGELRHHDALLAQRLGLAVLCVGHSYSERPVLPSLARRIRAALPRLAVAVSAADRDPFEIL